MAYGRVAGSWGSLVSYQLGVLATPVQIRTGPSVSFVSHARETKGSRQRALLLSQRTIVREIPLPQAMGAVVTSWRLTEPSQLLLRVRGQTDEIRLLCVCGRCHWILRERFGPDSAMLLVTCHHCGTRGELLHEGARLPKK